MRYLLDTCILSEARKKRPDRNCVRWMAQHAADSVFYVSAVTIGEIRHGIMRLGDDDPRRALLTSWLEEEILAQYGDAILPFDSSVASKWGEIMAAADREGRTRSPLDAQIVATALVHHLTIVTRNVADLDFAGAEVVNPFLDP